MMSISNDSPSHSPDSQSRKRLEWELSLSSDDIRSHAWFHGDINRHRAEQLLFSDGDFLVRDSRTHTGDYVLSTKSGQQCLHFVINKVILQPHTVYERIQFAFEDEAFESVSNLVTFYVGNRKPISSNSGAIILNPVNRTMPLNMRSGNFGPTSSSHQKQGSNSMRNELTTQTAPPKPIRISSESPISSPLKKSSQSIKTEAQEVPLSAPLSVPCTQSIISLKNFYTYLLPKNNKQLEKQTTHKIHSVLTETGARILANHLTKCNLNFISIDNKSLNLGMGVSSTLEQLLLPQGQQMRTDLLDRFMYLKNFIIVSLLSVEPDHDEDVMIILAKWIQIALECKTALGDCFAFEAIMNALSSPSITNMKQIWNLLRQRQTQTAICYETNLRPLARNMMDNPLEEAPNTTFPPVITLIHILSSDNNNDNHLDNIDLQQVNNHLDLGRCLMTNLEKYRRNATNVLNHVIFEHLLMDMFRTEFHIKYFWGGSADAGLGLTSHNGNNSLQSLEQLIANMDVSSRDKN